MMPMKTGKKPMMNKKMKKRHSAEHPGFESVAESIAQRMGVGMERGRAILASKTRSASAAAKRRNPRLLRVKGRG